MLKRWLTTVIPIVACAVSLSALQYWPTLHYGFHYDDYHLVRPHSASEIREVFRGPWDRTGIEVPFYRPLTVCFYAARFAAFGLNAYAYHALSLILFAAAATLFGVFAAQLFGRRGPGILACAIFAVHPAMPYSAVVWTTNQMHLIELLVVLASLLWWFAVRHRGLTAWMPLVVLQIIVLMIKEDGVMLIPTIVVLHTLRKYLVERDLRHVPLGFLGTAAIAMAGLLWFRSSVLHGIGGYRLPSADGAWSNLRRGFIGVFRLIPAERPYQPAASWFVTLLPPLAVALWTRTPRPTRFAFVTGLAMSCLFNLPFVFVVKAEQLHIVATGAALVLTASSVGILQAVPSVLVRVMVVCALGLGLFTMSAVSRHISRDFEPFGPIVLHDDVIVQGWAAVPSELREYLAEKSLPGAKERLSANPAEALDSIMFGAHGVERSPEGVRMRWMSSVTVDLFVRSGGRLVTIPLRHEIGAFRQPARATVTAGGRVLDVITFDDGMWRQSTVALRPNALGLRRMHHLQITSDRVWVPAEVMPGSTDQRVLGLQIGDVRVR